MDAEDVAGGVCFGGSEVWVAVSGPVQVLATRAATIKHLWVDRRQKVDLVRSASSYPFLRRSPGGTSKAQRYRVTWNRQGISVSGRNFTCSSLSRWLLNRSLLKTQITARRWFECWPCSGLPSNFSNKYLLVFTFDFILFVLYNNCISCWYCTNNITLNGNPTGILLNSFIKP